MSSEKNSFASDVEKSTTFKILIASDIHLGYNERHPLRGNDSFDSFEEVLQAASKHNVDFILLAGDLFHVNKPPMATINRAIELIRKYCFGEPDSDPCSQRFKISNFKNANFLDPNLRVKFPIFTIHGNHDDPSGVNQTSVIDILASSGLVNYLGKLNKVDEVKLSPVILKKGSTKIALYGLGSIHEERLANILRTDRFSYMQPKDPSSFLKIVVVHQNRVVHPNTKYLDPHDLDNLPDLVVWGHEHECINHLDYYEPQKFFILQPGSTVATSLSDSEVPPKHYVIMTAGFDEVTEKPKYKVDFHRLQTVRPFAMETFAADEILSDNRDGFRNTTEMAEYIANFCRNQIEEMIQTLAAQSEDEKPPMLPLIRLRILYAEPGHQFDPKPIQQEFANRVANCEEMIRLVKRAKANQKKEAFVDYGQNFEVEEMLEMLDDEVMQKQMQVSDVMDAYFERLPEKDRMTLYSHKYLNEQVLDFIRKENTDPLPELLGGYRAVFKSKLAELYSSETSHFDSIDLKKETQSIKDTLDADDDERRNIDRLIQQTIAGAGIIEKKTKKAAGGDKKTARSGWSDDDDEDQVEDDDDEVLVVKKRTTTSKNKLAEVKEEEEWMEDDMVVVPKTRGRGRGRAAAASGRGRGRPKKKEDDEDSDF